MTRRDNQQLVTRLRATISPAIIASPRHQTLIQVVAAPSSRSSRYTKDDLGLDHCEARSWHGWHRHMSLCMAALAFLAKLAADLRRATWGKANERSPAVPAAA